MSNLRQSISGLRNPRLIVSSLETTWYMRNQLLRDTDWSSMAHSLEVRVPLVDIELLRTVAHLVNNGTPPNKRDMAMTPDKQLPDSVLNRRKTGFSIPVQEWLLESFGSELPRVGRGLRFWATFLHQNAAKA